MANLRHPEQTLKWHLNRDGLSNKLLDDLMRMTLPENDCYSGVYPYTEIPASLASTLHFSVIVNVGQHFVAIYGEPEFILYLDPFGIGITHDEITHGFGMARPIFCNKKQVQDLKSTHCGLFSSLFIIHLERKRSGDSGYQNTVLNFYTEAEELKNNDKLCVQYIKDAIK